MLTTIVIQALVVFVLMFSPLIFPADRLPGWLRAVHSVLPLQAMGEVIRGSVASTTFTIGGSSPAHLGAWCLGGFAVAFHGPEPLQLSSNHEVAAVDSRTALSALIRFFHAAFAASAAVPSGSRSWATAAADFVGPFSSNVRLTRVGPEFQSK